MKFSMTWLEEHLETTATPQEIADVLTMIGLELSGTMWGSVSTDQELTWILPPAL